MNGELIDQKPAYNKIINFKVPLQLDQKVVAYRLKQIQLRPEGDISGRYNVNPMLQSMIYEVNFPDSQVNYYAENIIANNVLSHIDDKGYSFTFVNIIVDYKRDNSAVDMGDKYVVTRRRQHRLRNTNQGRKILVAWKDGSETCISLKDMK